MPCTSALALPKSPSLILSIFDHPVSQERRSIIDGAHGSVPTRWKSARTFTAEVFSLKDLRSDGHPEYIEVQVHDINDRSTNVLRCNNNNGADF